MSRTAAKIIHLHAIYTCTYGILFFGTPHSGSRKAHLLDNLQKMASLAVPKRVFETDSSLVRALEEDSEVLQNITDQFAPLMPRFHVFFFWEQERTDLKYTKDYIVNEASAAPILDNTERCGIAADHRTMCRFESKHCPGFCTVAAALRRYGQDAPGVVQARIARESAILSAQGWHEATELVRGGPESSLRHPVTEARLLPNRRDSGDRHDDAGPGWRTLEEAVGEISDQQPLISRLFSYAETKH